MGSEGVAQKCPDEHQNRTDRMTQNFCFSSTSKIKRTQRCTLQGTSHNRFQQLSTEGHRSDGHFLPFNKQCLKRQKYIHMGTEAIILSNRLLLKPWSSKQVCTTDLLASRLTIIFFSQVLKTHWKLQHPLVNRALIEARTIGSGILGCYY